jgi:hypothetical protein
VTLEEEFLWLKCFLGDNRIVGPRDDFINEEHWWAMRDRLFDLFSAHERSLPVEDHG